MGKLKNPHDHVTKNIAIASILNSRRPIVQLRPNLYQVYSMAWKVLAEKPEFSGIKNWIFKWTIFDYLKFPTSKFHDFFSFSCSKLKADAIRFFWSDAWLTSEEEPNLEKINKFCQGKIQTSIWFLSGPDNFQIFSGPEKLNGFIQITFIQITIVDECLVIKFNLIFSPF